MSGQFQTVDAVSWGAGRIDIFGWGVDRSLAHRECNNDKWEPWQQIPGYISQRPTPLSHSHGALSVFCISAAADIIMSYREANTGAWSAWIWTAEKLIAGRVA
jgi:hypothetical protein